MRNKAKTSSGSQTTCYVIAYDIPDDKRRTKVHKILLGFGKWTQYSLFECFLSRKELVLLRSKLAEHLVEKQDSVGQAEQCGAGRSSGYAEHGPALGSCRELTRKCRKNASLFGAKNASKKETRGNTCFLWLPMLY